MNNELSGKIDNLDNWSEVYRLAESYQKQQQWQQAAIAFQKAIELRADFFWSYHHLGDALTKLQQWGKAAIAYNRAVQIDPSFFWSWHNLGNALTKLQQWDRAAIAYNRAVQIDPSFFWSWHNLGNALTKLQQWDRAIMIYLKAIQLQPEHKQIYQKIGTALKLRGSLTESIQYYRKLIHSSDGKRIFSVFLSQPQTLLNVAETLVIEHQSVAAIVLYYMVLELQPDRFSVLTKLAELLQQQDRLQQNIASHRQTLQEELHSQPTANTTKPDLTAIPGKIVFKTDTSICPDELEKLRMAVGWSPRDLDRVDRSIENSWCHITAWHLHNDRQQLVGFARAVSDGTFHAVLLDILVHPDFQNRGLGKKIVRTAIEQLREADIKDITLYASPHIVDFYHQLGFVSQPNNLQLMMLCKN